MKPKTKLRKGIFGRKTQQGTLDVDAMEKDFSRMIDFWKQIYLKKGGE